MQSEWTRTKTLLSYSLLFVLAAAVPVFGQAVAEQPSIYSPEPVYNFGEQDNEENVKHDFKIMNAGTAPLELGKPKTSCGCTVAALAKTKLEPGEETTISAELKLTNRQGELTKSITVPSNDPDKPLFELKLEGVAVAAINIEPKYANFGRIMDAAPQERKITLTANKPGLAFNIQDVKSTSEKFEADLKTLEDGKSYELTIKTAPDMEPGLISGAITLQTDYAKRPVMQVRVNGQVVGPIDVLPNSINVSYAPGETTSQWLQVRPGRVDSFKITGIEVPVEGMSTEFRELNNNIFQVQVKDMPRDDTLEGKELIIKTDSEASPELRVPFRVIKPRTPTAALN
jgi:hypothetical protein